MLGCASPTRGSREQGNATRAGGSSGTAARFWSRWAPSAGAAELVRTCPTPFVRVPGILPGIWGAMVTLGMVVALALQALVTSADHLAVGPWCAVTLVPTVFGIVCAKLSFIVLSRRENRI